MAGKFSFLQLTSICFLGGAALVGCALPQLTDERFIRVSEVVDRVQCELRQSVEAYPQFDFTKWVGAFGLTLKVETNVGVDASVDWVIPFRGTETFKFGPSIGANNFIRREGNLKFDINFDKPLKKVCPEDPGFYRAYGDFGLQAWIQRIVNATSDDDRTSPKTFDYTLEFAVKLNGAGKPGFTIFNLTGAAGLSSDRTDNHLLTVAFTKVVVPDPPAPLWVCVENMAGAEKCRPKNVKALVIGRAAPTAPAAGVRQQLYQQLDLLRLRDQLRR